MPVNVISLLIGMNDNVDVINNKGKSSVMKVEAGMKSDIRIISDLSKGIDISAPKNTLFMSDIEAFLDKLPEEPIFDLVVTSPPYDIGKEYEEKVPLNQYLEWQQRIIKKISIRLKNTGSLCWEVGTYVENGAITPLDYELYPIFKNADLIMRNRIIWRFGHGLHSKKRFSGRHEVILWYTKSDEYIFNLDAVRIPAKYPGKRYYTGPKKGELSGNPLGKNPEDVWDIPNVKSRHVEKTIHPCQFPVALAERLILALSNENGLVFDPFCGVATTGVAALMHNRMFWGCEIEKKYVDIGEERLLATIDGSIKYRPDKPIFNPSVSALSKIPDEWKGIKR